MQLNTCSIEGCNEAVQAKQRCMKHYSQLPENIAYQRDWYKKNRDKRVERNRLYNRVLRYGITAEDRQKLYEAQEHRCAICRKEFELNSLVVDHDHSCCPGKTACGECVRGLLCDSCNKAIGIMKDDAKRLRAAADYVEVYCQEVCN